MKMNKKKVLVASLAISLIAILSFGTIAWFNATDEITNEFKVADSDSDNVPDFDVDIFETTEDGADEGTERDEVQGKDYLDILPGAQLAKDPTVRNTGDYPMYTRVIVTLSDAATWISASNKYNLTGEMDDTYILANMVTIDSNWVRYDAPVRDVDGDTITYVYYYNGIVEKDATTTALFANVTIPTQLQQVDMNYGDGDTFTIKVKADAVQAQNIIPADTTLTQNDAFKAFHYAGWTAGLAYPQP